MIICTRGRREGRGKRGWSMTAGMEIRYRDRHRPAVSSTFGRTTRSEILIIYRPSWPSSRGHGSRRQQVLSAAVLTHIKPHCLYTYVQARLTSSAVSQSPFTQVQVHQLCTRLASKPSTTSLHTCLCLCMAHLPKQLLERGPLSSTSGKLIAPLHDAGAFQLTRLRRSLGPAWPKQIVWPALSETGNGEHTKQ